MKKADNIWIKKEIPPFLISLESEREQLQSAERKTRQRPRHPRPLHLSVRVRQQSGQQQSHSRQQLTCLHPASQPRSPAWRRRRSYASVHTPPQSPARAPDLTGRASHRGGQPTDAWWRCLCSQRSVELLVVWFYSVIYLFLLSVGAYLSRFPTRLYYSPKQERCDSISLHVVRNRTPISGQSGWDC